LGDTFIHLIPLPAKVHALTIPDECGDFTIIVNSNLDDFVQRRALEHELKHVALDHFYDENNVAEDEREVEESAINENSIAM
jgi:hypothetical protein